jgi:hypothetical protein
MRQFGCSSHPAPLHCCSIAAGLRALGEILQEEAGGAAELLGPAGASAALCALCSQALAAVTPRVRALLGTGAGPRQQGLPRLASLAEVASAARAVVPPLLGTLRGSGGLQSTGTLLPQAQPGSALAATSAAGNEAVGAVQSLQREVLAGLRQAWAAVQRQRPAAGGGSVASGAGAQQEEQPGARCGVGRSVLDAGSAVARLGAVPELGALLTEGQLSLPASALQTATVSMLGG